MKKAIYCLGGREGRDHLRWGIPRAAKEGVGVAKQVIGVSEGSRGLWRPSKMTKEIQREKKEKEGKGREGVGECYVMLCTFCRGDKCLERYAKYAQH